MKRDNKPYLKIPINVEQVYNYSDMFKYIHDNGFDVHVYLSSSKFSIRHGQNNWDNFTDYIERFVPRAAVELEKPDVIELVFNARNWSLDAEQEVEKALAFCDKQRALKPRLVLLFNHPRFVKKYKENYDVCLSSASILSYKKIIDYLTRDVVKGLENDNNPKHEIYYTLPSSYQHLIYDLPVNSFIIMLQDGCYKRCLNAGCDTTSYDPLHSTTCPIQNIKQYEEGNKDFNKVDIVPYWEFMKLLNDGWRQFKIAGRQAPPERIFDTVEYYLRHDRVPYIDNHVNYLKFIEKEKDKKD